VTSTSLYRRPLPSGLIPFASAQGRALFSEALQEGTLESFFPIIEQFHTQADPAFCGLASLVVALNALGIDPGRLWRGPWRWFSEEMLDCCTPLEQVQQQGVSIEELACLARCNGADAVVMRPEEHGETEFRAAVEASARSAAQTVIIASFSRLELNQTGEGHFSPIGGYHCQGDWALVLDVARFKYPPYWVELSELYRAMKGADPKTGRSRGWISMQRRGAPSSIAYFISCRSGMGIGHTINELLIETKSRLRAAPLNAVGNVIKVAASAAIEIGLPGCIELRMPRSPEHESLFDSLRHAVVQSPTYQAVRLHYGEKHAELATAWLLAAPADTWSGLPSQLREELRCLFDLDRLKPELATEVQHVQKQVEFLLQHAREGGAHA